MYYQEGLGGTWGAYTVAGYSEAEIKAYVEAAQRDDAAFNFNNYYLPNMPIAPSLSWMFAHGWSGSGTGPDGYNFSMQDAARCLQTPANWQTWASFTRQGLNPYVIPRNGVCYIWPFNTTPPTGYLPPKTMILTASVSTEYLETLAEIDRLLNQVYPVKQAEWVAKLNALGFPETVWTDVFRSVMNVLNDWRNKLVLLQGQVQQTQQATAIPSIPAFPTALLPASVTVTSGETVSPPPSITIPDAFERFDETQPSILPPAPESQTTFPVTTMPVIPVPRPSMARDTFDQPQLDVGNGVTPGAGMTPVLLAAGALGLLFLFGRKKRRR